MEYIFKVPSIVRFDRSNPTLRGVHMGYCPSEDIIYIFGFCHEDCQFFLEAEDYEDVINHEHLHVILHTLNIKPKYHHKITDIIEEELKYHYQKEH